MRKIQVLDCTLRDGGYVNDWRFGKECINAVISAVSESGVGISELGFFRNETYSSDRTIFSSAEQIDALTAKKFSQSIEYAGLIEMANPFPIEMLSEYSGNQPKLIRYSFWKRLMDEAYEFCEKIVAKNYLLCCQPTRAEQYSYSDFSDMCKRFSKLRPYAVYIVDTFGLLDREQLIKYARVANDALDTGIILGYHAHNNMNQAFENAKAFIELDLGMRTKQIDATIGGIGRGAGNLELETILAYLNEEYNASYNIAPIINVRDTYMRKIKRINTWGYNKAYQIVAENNCNPNYASYFLERKADYYYIEKAVSLINGEDKYLFSVEKAKQYLEKVMNG